jgi:hypothetical protein
MDFYLVSEHTVDKISWSLWLSWLWKAESWHITYLLPHCMAFTCMSSEQQTEHMITYLLSWSWKAESWYHSCTLHSHMAFTSGLWRGDITPDQLDTYPGLEQLQVDIWQFLPDHMALNSWENYCTDHLVIILVLKSHELSGHNSCMITWFYPDSCLLDHCLGHLSGLQQWPVPLYPGWEQLI